MNICFIACFEKTIFFHKIAEQLERDNINVYWVSTSPKWTVYLTDRGVEKANILHLNDQSIDEITNFSEVLDMINDIERDNKHTLKQVYYMDRVLSHQPWSDVKRLFEYIIYNVSQFIKRNNIEMTFGEATAAHEVLTAMVVKTLKLKYFKPHTIRVPDDRFVFFEGYLEHRIFELTSEDWSLEDSENYLELYIEKRPKPYYFTLHNKRKSLFSLSFVISSVKKLKDTLTEGYTNFSEKSLYHHLFLEKKYLKSWNRFLIKHTIKFQTIRQKGKYVLYTMHVQPEASIDVLGIENNNQYETIKKIARNLPYSYILLVKEHSNALGMRDAKYLKAISKIPGVELVNPHQNSAELMKYVELVCSVSGTIGIESSILSKKSISLSPMFYNVLPFSYFDSRPEHINKYLDDTEEEEECQCLSEAFHSYVQYSHKGLISDPVSLPNCISRENIDSVANTFKKLVRHPK
jgi:hypothetical protein